MQVKTFKASTMEKALAMVKKELGPDAIILGSRKTPAGSGESGFEVSAARDLQPVAASDNPANGVVHSAELVNDIQEIKSFLSLLISSKDHLALLQANQPLAELYHSFLARVQNRSGGDVVRLRRFRMVGPRLPGRFQPACRGVCGKPGTSVPGRSLGGGGRSDRAGDRVG